ncbi:MAG: peptidylprolyl isomerase [Candidatus Cloacimonadaceae bacterium]
MKNSIVILVVLLSLTACSLFEKKEEIVAQVGKETLFLDEFKANFSDTEFNALTNEQKREYIQQWINLTLLSQEAEKLGLNSDKSVRNQVRYAEKKILGNALIATRLQSERISEEDLFKYYRIHQGDFIQPLMNYKVQRIYVSDASLAAKVRQEIINGLRFEDAAKIYSLEVLGQNGGYMGTVTPSDADSSFWQAVSKANLYDIVTLQKDNGFYLLRSYEEEQGTGEAGFDGLKDEIRKRILDERRKQVYDDLLRELKSKSDVYLMI